MDRNRLGTVAAGLLFALNSALPLWGAEADARLSATASITTDEVRRHVEVLADDTFEGREAGTRGNRAAGQYIIEALENYGFPGGGDDGGYYQTGPRSNSILAVVEGSDPELKKQVIVLGAHYDHVGYGTKRNSYGPIGYIHNGADDNASGVAALLEVADALARLPEHPKRTILLAFWDGEEKGLWGSKYWVEHPTVPLDRVPMAINIDMIGRLRDSELLVYGVRTAPGLRQLVSRQNTGPLSLDFNWDIKGDSDHYSFFESQIPFVMLHTGLHGDYHRPSDDVEKINNKGLRDISQLLFQIVLALADEPELGRFRSQSRLESEYAKRGIEVALAPPRGRLGVRWDEDAARDGRIVLTSVVPGSAAGNAGMQPGDRVLSFAGHEIANADQFRLAVLGAENPVPVTVERAGEEQPLELSLELPGKPVRVGIAWREDDAEPGTVIVNRLTPGSPASMAGIRPGDRIDRINGREFADGNEFRELAQTLPDPIVLEVETAGRVRTVELPTLETVQQETPPEDESSDGES